MRSVVFRELKYPKDPAYFRRRADQTRNISQLMLQPDIRKNLQDLAREYDELADDLANGRIDVRHRELMPDAADVRHT